jgi:hypothetical protein
VQPAMPCAFHRTATIRNELCCAERTVSAAVCSTGPNPIMSSTNLYRPVSNLVCIRQAHLSAVVANLPCTAQHHPLPASQWTAVQYKTVQYDVLYNRKWQHNPLPEPQWT